ncbi:MAG TPA: enoyl-CoA hydratase/isomerase family protein [Syntrophomonadaceae bacterium]|jgi:enoyl-CoA hydratase|nr:enoyl-CoA hydratase/isomerase family protein [Syntrophomonadaceae bacterium]HQD89882.1 enoyl-CoA hydratase/isomerase family protein [Syntrophomonadaceae bacterium]
MGFNTIVFSKDDAIATIQLNRPEAMNAINLQMLQEISTALDEIASDNNIRVLVLKGSDKVFAAGADIRDFVDYGPLEVRDYIQQAHLMGAKLNRLPKATIACMAGLALGGGCEIALGCDFRIAADNCKFGFPEINLGVFPAGGGTQRLARVVGCSRAKELILTGEIIDSQRAEQIGLVTKVVPADQLEEVTQKMARRLSRKPPLVVPMIKELLELSEHLDPTVGTMMEREKFSVLFATEDKTEGMKAFLEGRRAEFKGK